MMVYDFIDTATPPIETTKYNSNTETNISKMIKIPEYSLSLSIDKNDTEEITKSTANISNNKYRPLSREYYLLPINDKSIFLNQPLQIIIKPTSEGIYYINENLGIYAYGTTIEEAEKDFFIEINAHYNSYFQESKNALSADAVILKNKLKEFFGT